MEINQCPAGCKYFSGGEVKHDKACPHYPESLSELIDRQNEKIGSLTMEVDFLEDSQQRRREWLDKAKTDAGYHDSISFDVVWKEALAALLAQREQLTRPG